MNKEEIEEFTLLEILTGGDKMKLEKVRNMSDDELRKYLSMFGGKYES